MTPVADAARRLSPPRISRGLDPDTRIVIPLTGTTKPGELHFSDNETWLELILLAQDLLAWTRALILDPDSARLGPKRLRHRLLHVAGRLTRSGRRRTLHLPAAWPWAAALIAAFARLRALPAPG